MHSSDPHPIYPVQYLPSPFDNSSFIIHNFRPSPFAFFAPSRESPLVPFLRASRANLPFFASNQFKLIQTKSNQKKHSPTLSSPVEPVDYPRKAHAHGVRACQPGEVADGISGGPVGGRASNAPGNRSRTRRALNGRGNRSITNSSPFPLIFPPKPSKN